MRKEEIEKKAQEAEEKRKKMEEAEKKRQEMMKAQKEKMGPSGSGNKKKGDSGVSTTTISLSMIHHFISMHASDGQCCGHQKGNDKNKGAAGGREENFLEHQN